MDTFNINNIPTGQQFTEQDVLKDDNGKLVGYWNGEGWHKGWGDLGNVTVTGNGKGGGGSSSGDALSTGLDLLGASELPVLSQLADLTNSAVSFYKGDISGGFINLLSAIPLVGKIGDGLKLAKYVDKGLAAAKGGRGLWKLTDAGASTIKRHSEFGKIFKSQSDGLWWLSITQGTEEVSLKYLKKLIKD